MADNDQPRERTSLKISSAEVEAIRSSHEKQSYQAWRKIQEISRRWVEFYSGGLTAEDLDDIVDSAIAETLESILSPDVPASEVSLLLARSLNTHRARARREKRHQSLYSKEFQGLAHDAHLDESIIGTAYIDVLLRTIRGAMDVALNALPDRYYRLIVAAYSLPDSGLRASGASSLDLNSKNERRALQRARHKFASLLEGELERSLAEGTPETREITQTALKIVRGGHLPEVQSFIYEQQKNNQRTQGEAAQPLEVSPPALAIVWDPEVVTEQDYAEIVAALGDLVRSEGGIGIQLLDHGGIGVEVPVEVAV